MTPEPRLADGAASAEINSGSGSRAPFAERGLNGPSGKPPIRVTLDMVAQAVGGIVIGDGTTEITGVAGIREAREGELTFLAHPRYEPYLEQTRASAVIVADDHRALGKPLIQNPNPYLAFLNAVRFFRGDEERPAPGFPPSAVVAPEACVDATATVGPNAVVERSEEHTSE